MPAAGQGAIDTRLPFKLSDDTHVERTFDHIPTSYVIHDTRHGKLVILGEAELKRLRLFIDAAFGVERPARKSHLR